ncbi:hypothetical protein Emed_000884 [Eimeria media]
MADQRTVRFQGEVGDVLGQLSDQRQKEQEAHNAAVALVRTHKELDGPVTSPEQKKALIAEGQKAKQRAHESQLLSKDGSVNALGGVLKKQAPLMRREMFRRRLFPIRFEDSAKNVEEVQQLLMKRQPVGQLVVSLFYLAMLLLFASYALEISRLFEAADGIRTPVMTAVAPSASNFNAVSFAAAKAQQDKEIVSDVVATPETGRPVDISSLKNKASVASWILYGLIPLFYGTSANTSNLGPSRIIGNCFRLTFRQLLLTAALFFSRMLAAQVQLQEVTGFDLGYEGEWPLFAAGAASSIAETSLRSDNPLTSPPNSRFTYSYPYAAPGESAAFDAKGGYYQVICKAEEAQAALQQDQSPSRYPPWIVPAPVIADRRTISAVVDFFVVNPLTRTFSHCSVLFAFTSAEKGYYDITGAPAATDEAGFFQLISDYDNLFYSSDVAHKACIIFGSLSAITGCLLTTRLFPAIAGAGTKCLQMTFRKVKYYLLACIVGMLAILFIFVCLGNISFGAATRSFTGYYERTRYEWLKQTVAQSWNLLWRDLSLWRGEEGLGLLGAEDDLHFEDDLKEARELKLAQKSKQGLRRRTKKEGKDYYRRERDEDASSSADEYFDSPPQYPTWVWEAMGLEDPLRLYAAQPGSQYQGIYVDPASMTAYSRTYGWFSGFDVSGYSGPSDSYFTTNIAAATAPKAPAPSVPKVYALIRNQRQQDHEDAWKKLFVVAFVAIIVATVSLQLSVNETAELRQVISRSFSSTGFPLQPVQLMCNDQILGLQNLNVTISFPDQSVSGARTAADLYKWLAADQGLMAFIAPTTSDSLFGQVFPTLQMPDGTSYQQQVLSSWNSTISTRSVRVTLNLREESTFPTQLGFSCVESVCEYQALFDPTKFQQFLKGLAQGDVLRDVVSELAFQLIVLNLNQGRVLSQVYLRFPRNEGGVISPLVSVDAFNLRPYAAWDTATIGATALQVASLSLFLFFGCSFIVEFYRLSKSLKEEREDFSWSLCLGVFFVDDLFNLFDVIGFGVLASAIGVWVRYVLASPNSQVFDLVSDLKVAAAASAAGGTQESEAVQAAIELFASFASTASLLQTYAQLSAAILAVAFLRLLRIGRKRKRMTLIFFTLASAAEEMLEILAGTLLMFIGFAFVCFFSFGRQVEGHSTIKKSFVSTILLTMGYFPLSQLFLADAVMAGTVIFPYLFFVGIVCFSFFLCVILRSLAYRSAEIKAMERLDKTETPSLLNSLLTFFRELMCCRQQTRGEVRKHQESVELEHLQQKEMLASHLGEHTDNEQEGGFSTLSQLKEELERKRRERPLKVTEMPSDVLTTTFSDQQYAALPQEIRLFASQEVAFFVDRFRFLMTQLKLAEDVTTFLQKLGDEVYSELSTLSREVARQEGHLRHELSIYTSQSVRAQERLSAYIKFLEQALQKKEEELQFLKQELEVFQTKSTDESQSVA